MAEDNTLPIAMMMIEQLHQFRRSPRKWNAKMKEWNFEKNLTKREMKVVVAKAEKRATEQGKDTIFFHNRNLIPPAKISNWKRKLTAVGSSPLNPYTKTPATIAYFTPQLPNISAAPTTNLVMFINMLHEDFILTTSTAEKGLVEISSTHTLDPLLIQPEDYPAALQYYGLKFERNGIVYRFHPRFIYAVLSSSLESKQHEFLSIFRTEAGYWPFILLDLLGQSLARNGDNQRAAALASFMSGPASRYSSITSSHFLGWWFHRGELYEESIPYLEDVLLHVAQDFPIRDLTFQDYRPGFFFIDLSAAGMLHRAYKHLGPERSWREICDRVHSPENKPFSHRVWDMLREETSRSRAAGGHGEADLLLSRIEARLRSFFAHILPPSHTSRVYVCLAARHLRRSYFHKCASKLLSEFRTLNLNPEELLLSGIGFCPSYFERMTKLVQHIEKLGLGTPARGPEAEHAFNMVIEEVHRYLSGPDQSGN